MFPIRDHNPSGSTPYVTIALIAMNLAVFLAGLALAQGEEAQIRLVLGWGMIPRRILSGQGYETLLTSMFLHGSWLHVGGNMLFLWIFGDNMEDRLGRLGFLAFYIGCGLAAAGLQIAMDPGSEMPMVGASGAIAGVLGGYVLLYPRARVDVVVIFVIFYRIVAFPAWIVLGLWFVTQIFAGAAIPADAGGVAYWAHVGGFGAGVLAALADALIRGRPPAPGDSPGPTTRSVIPRVPRR